MYGTCCGGDCRQNRGRGWRYGSGRDEFLGSGRFGGWSPEMAHHFGGGYGGGFGWGHGPTKAERKEWLENFKKHLEERLSDVNEEIEKL